MLPATPRGTGERMIRRTLLGLAMLCMAAPARAALQTLDEVQDCMDGNLPDPSSVQVIVMNAHDRIGSVTQTRAKIYWRKFKKKSFGCVKPHTCRSFGPRKFWNVWPRKACRHAPRLRTQR